jgi:hypothetical protein
MKDTFPMSLRRLVWANTLEVGIAIGVLSTPIPSRWLPSLKVLDC